MSTRLFPILGKCFAIRLTMAFNEINPLLMGSIAGYAEGTVVVQHGDQSRVHVHMALWNVMNITHDHLRKQIVKGLKEYHPGYLESFVEGDKPLHVGKWDGHEKHLVYMFKGKYFPTYNFIDNERLTLTLGRQVVDQPVLTNDEIERLQKLWKSNCTEENEYSEWKGSIYWPKSTEILTVIEPEHISVTTGKLMTEAITKITLIKPLFEEVKDKAIEFAIRETKFVNAKSRNVAKNLISNFCIRHKIKIPPYHI
jgi:hypothetical protein